MNHHRPYDAIEQRLSKRGRENVALAVLATSCLAGIVLLNRIG